MGCLCSKAMTRSMSIREELSHGLHNANLAWEDLLASNNGNDQRFSFLYSAKTRTNEPRASSFTSPSIDDDDDDLGTKYFVNSLDLIPDIRRPTEVKPSPDFGELGKHTRSKSHQLSRERELSDLSFETAEVLNENKLDWRDKNLRGSRSFHTVEEYDALLGRIHKSNTRSTESFEDYHSSHKFNSLDEDQNGSNILPKEFLDNEPGIEEFVDLNKGTVHGENTRESGWKRKAAAKGLKSLDVSAVEFPAIAILGQWKQAEGQVYSPGTYVTPKFGSYNDMKIEKTRDEDGAANAVFSPELLAAFEDCVQQLQIEEDSILCDMYGYMRVDNGDRE